MRRVAVVLVGLLAPMVLLPAVTPRRARADAPPNVVVIITDDQRWDTLTPRYMPNVSAMLTDTTRTTTFTNAFVPNPLCCPSRASILTGVYSHTSGVYANRPPYGGFTAFDDDPSIATVLDSDYRTVFVGKYLNGIESDFGYIPPGWDRWFGVPSGKYYGYAANDNGLEQSYGSAPRDYSGRVLTDRAVAELDAAAAGPDPSFLVYAPVGPHSARGEGFPIPDPRDLDRFSSEPRWRPPSFGFQDDVGDMPLYIRSRPWTADDRRFVDRFRERQLESVFGLDRAIARLMRHVTDDTLVLFLSDNGIMWGEHRRTKKIVPYEESIRVPMWARWPAGLNTAAVDPDRLALNVDLVPTILDVAGYPADTPTASAHYALGDQPVPPEGTSLLSAHPPSAFALEHWAPKGAVPGYCGVRTAGGLLYTRYWDRGSSDNGFEELYDVSSDPYQMTNRAGDPSMTTAMNTLRDRAEALCAPAPPYYIWGE